MLSKYIVLNVWFTGQKHPNCGEYGCSNMTSNMDVPNMTQAAGTPKVTWHTLSDGHLMPLRLWALVRLTTAYQGTSQKRGQKECKSEGWGPVLWNTDLWV